MVASIGSAMRASILGILILLGSRSWVSSFQTSYRKRPLAFLEERRKTTIVSLTPRMVDLVHRQAGKINSLSGQADSSLGSSDEEIGNTAGIDLAADPRLYQVRISRAAGIDWGTDLSFAFVYVRDMDPTGAAAMCGQIKKGDQLCQIMPVAEVEDDKLTEPVNVIGASFDNVMTTFASLDRAVREVDLVFFRGTKEDLKAACTGAAPSTGPETITVTVVQNKGSTDSEMIRQLQAPVGVNLRQLLVDNGINVYQSVTRWTNCKGKQLCGTCIVNIPAGAQMTNRKSMDEASTLRENPDSYRLSCITFAYGDVTVETFPPINAAQWTR